MSEWLGAFVDHCVVKLLGGIVQCRVALPKSWWYGSRPLTRAGSVVAFGHQAAWWPGALWTNVCDCVVCVPSSCLAEGLYDRKIPVVKLLGGRGVVGMVSLEMVGGTSGSC